MQAVDELLALLRSARRALVFTGAGVSTGSGIPDFRGPEGVWKKRAPVYFQELLASEEKRVEYWDGKQEGWEAFRDARPNATHRAIAKLEQMGLVHAVVTQNIDGLHQLGGSDPARVLELHGTNRWIECLSCRTRSDPDPVIARFRQTRVAPRCRCGGILKPATISFGQPLTVGLVERAIDEARKADLVLALGTTLSVHPAASVPLAARRNGAVLVIVNRGETDQDALAALKVDDDVAAVVPPAVERLAAERGSP